MPEPELPAGFTMPTELWLLVWEEDGGIVHSDDCLKDDSTTTSFLCCTSFDEAQDAVAEMGSCFKVVAVRVPLASDKPTNDNFHLMNCNQGGSVAYHANLRWSQERGLIFDPDRAPLPEDFVTGPNGCVRATTDARLPWKEPFVRYEESPAGRVTRDQLAVERMIDEGGPDVPDYVRAAGVATTGDYRSDRDKIVDGIIDIDHESA